MLHKIKLLIPLVGLLAISCKKFLDINTDPNNPTTIEVSKLLPTTQRTLGDALSMDEQNGGLSEVLAVYAHQMSTREEADKYGITGADPNLHVNIPLDMVLSSPVMIPKSTKVGTSNSQVVDIYCSTLLDGETVQTVQGKILMLIL